MVNKILLVAVLIVLASCFGETKYNFKILGDRLNKLGEKNDRPIIGITAQPLMNILKKDPRFDDKTSQLMKFYSQHLEASGARTMPLFFNEPWETTLEKLNKVSGVLFPGGPSNLG